MTEDELYWTYSHAGGKTWVCKFDVTDQELLPVLAHLGETFLAAFDEHYFQPVGEFKFIFRTFDYRRYFPPRLVSTVQLKVELPADWDETTIEHYKAVAESRVNQFMQDFVTDFEQDLLHGTAHKEIK